MKECLEADMSRETVTNLVQPTRLRCHTQLILQRKENLTYTQRGERDQLEDQVTSPKSDFAPGSSKFSLGNWLISTNASHLHRF